MTTLEDLARLLNFRAADDKRAVAILREVAPELKAVWDMWAETSRYIERLEAEVAALKGGGVPAVNREPLIPLKTGATQISDRAALDYVQGVCKVGMTRCDSCSTAFRFIEAQRRG